MGYKTTLGDVSLDGGHYGIAAPAVDFKPGLPAYLRITDISDDGTLNPSDRKSVDDSSAGNYLLHEGDIVFARTGNSTGRNYYYDPRDGEYAYAGFLIKFSLDLRKINPRYMKYYAQSKQYWDWVSSFNTGSTRGNINAKTYASMPIDLPSRQIQDAIVAICDAIDDKIRINRQLNDYLANLLDAAFANSAKSGSKEFGLPEVVDILSGGTPKTKNAEYWEDGRIPFFTPGDVTNSVYTLTTEKHITDVGLDNCNSELYPVDTVFLTARGTVGKVAIAGRPMAMNQSCFAFRGKSIPQSVVFQIIKNAVKTLRAKANGATFAAINTRDLKIETVAVPCNKEIAHYDESASKWLDLIRTNEEENLQLSALRDILLPKLMSGEIDVSKVDLTQLTNNHLPLRGHNVPNCYWKGHLWKPSLIVFCRRCRTCLIRHSSNIWPKYSESRCCQLRKHQRRRIC